MANKKSKEDLEKIKNVPNYCTKCGSSDIGSDIKKGTWWCNDCFENGTL